MTVQNVVDPRNTIFAWVWTPGPSHGRRFDTCGSMYVLPEKVLDTLVPGLKRPETLTVETLWPTFFGGPKCLVTEMSRVRTVR